jgi:hypothetical protein
VQLHKFRDHFYRKSPDQCSDITLQRRPRPMITRAIMIKRILLVAPCCLSAMLSVPVTCSPARSVA